MKPYLSIVVTSRNDNHGGDLNKRMQTFLNALASQFRRFPTPAELIVVEWNPPSDRPRLAEQLNWPFDGTSVDVRIIEVPSEVHSQFEYADSLPLFQMIAKNVGIRRARGEFILCTNIDLVFSDELMDAIQQRIFQRGCYYRVDRYDVDEDVPVNAPIEVQLAYCEANIIRYNTRNYTEDVRLNQKFYIYEQSETSRNDIAIPLKVTCALRKTAKFLVTIPLKVTRALREKRLVTTMRTFWRVKLKRLRRALKPLQKIAYLPRKILFALSEKRLAVTTIRYLRINRLNYIHSRIIGRLFNTKEYRQQITVLPKLYSNACGDFTLMSSDDWLKMGGYAEFEIFSLHIDTIGIYSAHYAGIKEQYFAPPILTYHIEHSSGLAPDQDKATSLIDNMQKRKVPVLSWSDVHALLVEMQHRKINPQLNDNAWGLRDHILSETVPKLPISKKIE